MADFKIFHTPGIAAAAAAAIFATITFAAGNSSTSVFIGAALAGDMSSFTAARDRFRDQVREHIQAMSAGRGDGGSASDGSSSSSASNGNSFAASPAAAINNTGSGIDSTPQSDTDGLEGRQRHWGRKFRNGTVSDDTETGAAAPAAAAAPAMSAGQLTALKQTMVDASRSQAATAQHSADHNNSAGNFHRGEVLAVNMDASSLAVAHALGFGVDYAAGDDEGMYRFTRLTVPEGTDTLTALRTLKVALPGKTVALNSFYHIFERSGGAASPTTAMAPGSACTAEQCRPRKIIGWKDQLRDCSAGLAIGMIDTGIDTSHPALASSAGARRIVTETFRLDNNKPSPTEHGTGVAALLVGDSRQGIPGLVPDVTLFAADAFYSVDGQPVTDTVSVLRALDWMRRHDVHIVNMSFAGPDDPLLAAAIRQSIREGMVIVAAAGNEGEGAPPAFPAAYPGVIAVTAVTSDLKAYQRANRGAYIALAAPGVHIWTASTNGKATYASGTSFAAPYVTAIAATLLRAAGPAASPKQILQAIPVKSLDNAEWSPVFGHGLAMAPADCGAAQLAESLPWDNLPWSDTSTTASTASTVISTKMGYVSAGAAP